MENRNQLQFYVRKTDKNLIEIVSAFEIDKVKIGFRTFNNENEKGSKLLSKVDFYLSIPEFELLCHNLLTGFVLKTDNYEPIYKGSERDGAIMSRALSFAKARVGLFFTACEGPGRKTSTGAVIPLYKNDVPTKISIPLKTEEVKMFALQGKRACDYYYNNYFEKNLLKNQGR